jgi:hypothetical protein
VRTWGTLTALVLALFVFMWAIDFITLEGEWTLYGAQCTQGKWLDAERCSGKLEAGERHRFRALKKKGEVVFWTVGSPEPSGKLAPCVIQSRSDWKCEAGGDGARALTLELHRGEAVPQTGVEVFHALPKWKWFLLKYGP